MKKYYAVQEAKASYFAPILRTFRTKWGRDNWVKKASNRKSITTTKAKRYRADVERILNSKMLYFNPAW